MAKGVSIRFKSYNETVPKLLDLIKLGSELKKHNKIILKPHLSEDKEKTTPAAFVEEVLKYCLNNKESSAEVFIAEGADGVDTMDLFEENGYKGLAERYSIGLIDLNNTEVEEVINPDFIKFEEINYPRLLLEGFVISLPKLSEDEHLEMVGASSIMVGAYPSSHYSGLFSSKKSKIKKWPIKYSVHDILLCKNPNLGVIDASAQGMILAGVPLEMDKQAARLLGREWKAIGYLKLVDESFLLRAQKEKEKASNKEKSESEEE